MDTSTNSPTDANQMADLAEKCAMLCKELGDLESEDDFAEADKKYQEFRELSGVIGAETQRLVEETKKEAAFYAEKNTQNVLGMLTTHDGILKDLKNMSQEQKEALLSKELEGQLKGKIENLEKKCAELEEANRQKDREIEKLQAQLRFETEQKQPEA